jgi:N-acetylglutamate synthase-like GNAT family acetyltransferase
MTRITVRPASADDRAAVVRLLTGSWGSTTVVTHGSVYDASALPALLAEQDGRVAGLLTYVIEDRTGMEIVSLDAVERRSGAGTALLGAAAETARAAGVERLWLATTNDNLDALRFYQRRGMRIVGVTPGAVDESRSVKPTIPLVGDYGIELHDELTLELRLG